VEFRKYLLLLNGKIFGNPLRNCDIVFCALRNKGCTKHVVFRDSSTASNRAALSIRGLRFHGEKLQEKWRECSTTIFRSDKKTPRNPSMVKNRQQPHWHFRIQPFLPIGS